MRLVTQLWLFRDLIQIIQSVKHNIIFGKCLEILLDNNVITCTHSMTKQKLFGSHWVSIFRFLIKGTISPNFLRMLLTNSTPLGFSWLTKSVETIKLYNRIFRRCYSCAFVFPCYYRIFYLNGNSCKCAHDGICHCLLSFDCW